MCKCVGKIINYGYDELVLRFSCLTMVLWEQRWLEQGWKNMFHFISPSNDKTWAIAIVCSPESHNDDNQICLFSVDLLIFIDIEGKSMLRRPNLNPKASEMTMIQNDLLAERCTVPCTLCVRCWRGAMWPLSVRRLTSLLAPRHPAPLLQPPPLQAVVLCACVYTVCCVVCCKKRSWK